MFEPVLFVPYSEAYFYFPKDAAQRTKDYA